MSSNINNQTTNDATDDYFTIDVKATIINGGSLNKFVVVKDAITGQGGTSLNGFGTASGSTVNVSKFKADGTTAFILTVRDFQNPSCYFEIPVSAVSSCSVAVCSPVPVCLPLSTKRN